ncbi:unnamed protein product, partial [Ectocarpus sp. 12 AP-2014]
GISSSLPPHRWCSPAASATQVSSRQVCFGIKNLHSFSLGRGRLHDKFAAAIRCTYDQKNKRSAQRTKTETHGLFNRVAQNNGRCLSSRLAAVEPAFFTRTRGANLICQWMLL